MKKIIIIAAFIVIGHTAFSQLRLGVVGSYGVSLGESTSKILGTPEGRKAMEIAFLESKNLPSVGISLTSDFGPLFGSAEVHYRKNAYTFSVQNFLKIDEPMNYVEETSSVIHIPITGGVKIGILRLGAGPIFNFQTGQSKGQLKGYHIEEKKRDLQTGFLGSIGVDIGKHLRVGMKYEHSFAKVGDDYKYAGKKLPIKSTLNYLTFNVGMYF
ncbi:MAG: hypothetical protein ACI9P5_003459 [Saprospiraceae bacterium]|jgi:hypothetical protein|tara:strand:+ start:1333 stop:1971 length:639 start_codon:yes stop_codon:yes gene_type:complete